MGCASSAALAASSIHPGSTGSRSIVKDAGSQTTVTVRIASSANARNEAHTVRKEQIASHRTEALARAYELSNEKSGYTTTTYTGSCISTPRSAYSRTRKVQGSQGSGGSDSGSKCKSSVGGSTIRNNLTNKSQVSFRNEEYNNLMVKSASKQRKSYSSSAHPRVSQIQKKKSVSNLGKRKVSSPGSQKSESSVCSENKQADTGYEGSDEYQTSQPSSSTKSLLNSPQIPSEPPLVDSESTDVEMPVIEPSENQEEIPEVSRSLSKISENAPNIDTVSSLNAEIEGQAISETETITQSNSLVDENNQNVEPEKQVSADVVQESTENVNNEKEIPITAIANIIEHPDQVDDNSEKPLEGVDQPQIFETEADQPETTSEMELETKPLQIQPDVVQVVSMETDQTVGEAVTSGTELNDKLDSNELMIDRDDIDSGQGGSPAGFVDEERVVSRILVGGDSNQTIVKLDTGLGGSVSEMPLVS